MQALSCFAMALREDTQEDCICPVPHPDVFYYHLNSMGAPKNVPKKVLATLLPYIFHVKTK